MPARNYRFRNHRMRFRTILFVFLFTIHTHYASSHFGFAQDKTLTSIESAKSPRPVTGRNSPAANYPQWVDDKTGRVLFDAKDIVRFDWEKQIFELSRRRAMDLTVHMREVSQFAIRDKAGLIYRGRFIPIESSIAYNGPTIVNYGFFIGIIRPPWYAGFIIILYIPT